MEAKPRRFLAGSEDTSNVSTRLVVAGGPYGYISRLAAPCRMSFGRPRRVDASGQKRRGLPVVMAVDGPNDRGVIGVTRRYRSLLFGIHSRSAPRCFASRHTSRASRLSDQRRAYGGQSTTMPSALTLAEHPLPASSPTAHDPRPPPSRRPQQPRRPSTQLGRWPARGCSAGPT